MFKHLKFLILLVLPFSLAMTLTSCSDDDNENLEDGNEETSLLVGSWVYDDYDYYEILTFNSNGTFKEVSYDEYNDIDWITTGKYRYDSSTQILLLSWYDDYHDEAETAKFKVLSISSIELILTEDGVTPLTYTRKIE